MDRERAELCPEARNGSVCGVCGRDCLPDGDCYGCEADRLTRLLAVTVTDLQARTAERDEARTEYESLHALCDQFTDQLAATVAERDEARAALRNMTIELPDGSPCFCGSEPEDHKDQGNPYVRSCLRLRAVCGINDAAGVVPADGEGTAA